LVEDVNLEDSSETETPGEDSTVAEVLDLRDITSVGPATARKLKEAGYTTVESIAVTPVRELVDQTGLGKETAFKICNLARSMLKIEFLTAAELYDKEKTKRRLTTGTEQLDALLGGGIETQAMTEFIGEFGTGKSQICMKLCVTAQLPPEKGGLDGRVLFIDTEGTFSPKRICQIAERMGLDSQKILENIVYARAYNSDHQMLIVDKSYSVCREEGVKLLILDSIISHFRGEYIGRESLSERQQKLNSHLHKLLRIAEIYNLAIVVTNQCQANPQAFFGPPNRPAGGNIMAHACTHRVFLRKSKGNTRVAKIIDSPYLPSNDAAFQIDESGVSDVEK
jgi:DNA repair protein RadA